jgi:hypothetical protein
MVARWHPTSLLLALPGELAIEIASHLTVTLERPMDNLCSLWVTCSSMHRICGNLAIGRRVALDQCRRGLGWDDVSDYYALLSSLTQLDNSEACFLTKIPMVFEETHMPQPCLDDLAHATDGGLNLASYLVTILLYRHNGDAHNDDTTRRYMRRVEGKEESWAAIVADQQVGGYATRGVCCAAVR